MQEKHEVLEELGLSKNEAKIYLKLLETGSATGGQIADAAKIHRPNAYDALERLVSKSLVRYIIVDNVKYFEAVNPSALSNILHRKFEMLDRLLPQLMMLQKMQPQRAPASIHEGISAFRNILYNLLEYEDEITVTGVPAKAPLYLKNFISGFHNERMRRKIWMRHIYNEDAKDRIGHLNTMEYTAAKHLPKEYDAPVSTLTCGEEVILILWNVAPLVLIRIVNKELAISYKKYFKLLWQKSRR